MKEPEIILESWSPYCDVQAFVEKTALMEDARLMKELSSPVYPEFKGDKINLLWAVPVKQDVYEAIMEQGTDEMLKRMDIQNTHIFD
ncbi:hypothetical protein [Desulfitobacterium chlororespirans]|uniref:Uncharacterized protein n=1 Tax=Desulfitobacterium chlororespirans DSM 11544 TaxID=1121395 RepID=A0A1M7TV41_9FIRM|nr:hypothetical protein [Desulfitobacterium chlororespirans]SHN74581.1 hypothetical protein SAMN02745215_02532 [Desulfitobacterium chlororespirans DSM 11544]